jgi:hypothetical protein
MVGPFAVRPSMKITVARRANFLPEEDRLRHTPDSGPMQRPATAEPLEVMRKAFADTVQDPDLGAEATA